MLRRAFLGVLGVLPWRGLAGLLGLAGEPPTAAVAQGPPRLGEKLWLGCLDVKRQMLVAVPYRVTGRYDEPYADGSGRRWRGWVLVNLADRPDSLPGHRGPLRIPDSAGCGLDWVKRTPAEAIARIDAILADMNRGESCEECGGPARMAVCDVRQVAPLVRHDGTAWEQYERDGPTRHYCVAHARRGRTLKR